MLICKILICILDKKFLGIEIYFEMWDIFWVDKGCKGNGVEIWIFNFCYGGNLIFFSCVFCKGIRVLFVFFVERYE